MSFNWNAFKEQNHLSDRLVNELSQYAQMIIEWNQKFNLTTITKEQDIANFHFQDALALQNILPINTIKTLADIGTGAGIPAIPLKICYPHLQLILIEVNTKKRTFLQAVIDALGLLNVVIVADDWRTFLRHTNYDVDLFCARASLQPEELIRMFKDTSPYKKSCLVYWASKYWQPSNEIALYVKQTYTYTISDRTYNLIKMANVTNQ